MTPWYMAPCPPDLGRKRFCAQWRPGSRECQSKKPNPKDARTRSHWRHRYIAPKPGLVARFFDNLLPMRFPKAKTGKRPNTYIR
jgi:hypothetical protein